MNENICDIFFISLHLKYYAMNYLALPNGSDAKAKLLNHKL